MTSKRLFDLTIVVLSAPFVVVALVVLAVLVRVKLGSPVFFTQVRPGRKGQPFRLVKFRSMTDERGSDGLLLPDRDRLTAFGRFLRSSSLDELPEIMNVLAGEMSLVGPRPLLMDYLPLYSKKQARRHEVLPGITGLAQIKGRNAISWPQKFALDVWYVDHHTILMDFKILLATVAAVFRREGISAQNHATAPRFEGETGAGGQDR